MCCGIIFCGFATAADPEKFWIRGAPGGPQEPQIRGWPGVPRGLADLGAWVAGGPEESPGPGRRPEAPGRSGGGGRSLRDVQERGGTPLILRPLSKIVTGIQTSSLRGVGFTIFDRGRRSWGVWHAHWSWAGVAGTCRNLPELAGSCRDLPQLAATTPVSGEFSSKMVRGGGAV